MVQPTQLCGSTGSPNFITSFHNLILDTFLAQYFGQMLYQSHSNPISGLVASTLSKSTLIDATVELAKTIQWLNIANLWLSSLPVLGSTFDLVMIKHFNNS